MTIKAKEAAREREEVTSGTPSCIDLPPVSEGEGTLTAGDPQLTFYKSNHKREDDPMVSGTITPFLTQMEIIVPHSGAKEVVKVLIDSGCTHCLVSLQTKGSWHCK